MITRVVGFSIILSLFLFFVPTIFAQNLPQSKQVFEKAKVVEVVREGFRTIEGVKNPYQNIRLFMVDGVDKGKTISLKSGYTTTLTPSQVVKKGENCHCQ